jgi:hypothetical protein
MPLRVQYKVLGPALVAADHEAVEQFATLKHGQQVEIEVYKRRPDTLDRTAHLLFQAIAVAMMSRVRNVRSWLAIGTGRGDDVQMFGRTVTVAHATGPGDMDRNQYVAFLRDASDLIADEILPQLADPRDVLDLLNKLNRHLAEEP